MRSKEFITEAAAFTRGPYSVVWHPDEDTPGGKYVVHKGEDELQEFPYTDRFKDMGEAYQAAKKRATDLHTADKSKERTEREAAYQAKPLRPLEVEWLTLDKKLVQAAKRQGPALTDQELARYERLSSPLIIRSSLLDGTHPESSHRRKQ